MAAIPGLVLERSSFGSTAQLEARLGGAEQASTQGRQHCSPFLSALATYAQICRLDARHFAWQH